MLVLCNQLQNILIDGQEVRNISAKQRDKLMEKFGFFQGGALFDSANYLGKYCISSTLSQENAKNKQEKLLWKKSRQLDLIPELPIFILQNYLAVCKNASLARAIATTPEIIFFDEPTTGLDPIIADVLY